MLAAIFAFDDWERTKTSSAVLGKIKECLAKDFKWTHYKTAESGWTTA